jgi:hypothetical protein
MKPLGFVREMMAYDAVEYPQASSTAGSLPQELVPLVVSYLERGTGVIDVMEATRDPAAPGKYISGGSSLYTDGEWVWRMDLPNYVRAYRMALPAEFVERAFAAICAQKFPSVDVDSELSRRVLQAAGWG